MPRTRPTLVTLFCLAGLIPVLVYGLRFIQAIRQWEFLHSLPLQISPLYLALSGAAFSLGGLLALWGLWCGRAWATAGVGGWVLGQAGAAWFERLVLADPPGGGADWPFALGATLLLLAFCAWMFTRPNVRVFLG